MNTTEAMKKYGGLVGLTSYARAHRRRMHWNGYDWVVRGNFNEVIYHGKDENDALDILFAEEEED